MNSQSKFFLDRELFEDLKIYLEDKKDSIRDTLLASLAGSLNDKIPLLELPDSQTERLKDSVKVFEDQCDRVPLSELTRLNQERLLTHLNLILANYCEILEGMCRELFLQLKALDIEYWDQELYDKVESTKVYLWDKLIEVEEFIDLLEVALKRLCRRCLRQRGWGPLAKLQLVCHNRISSDLKKQIRVSELYLHEQFKLFSQSFILYKRKERTLEAEKYKFQGFGVFAALDADDQAGYAKLFKLLKLGGGPEARHRFYSERLIHSLKQGCPIGKSAPLFRRYLNLFKTHLFEMANRSRMNPDRQLQAKITLYRTELSLFTHTLKEYRLFLLSVEGDSFRRRVLALLGFRKWSAAAESRKTKELLELVWESEKVDGWFVKLSEAQGDPHEKDKTGERLVGVFKEINKILKDMSQPLISKQLMRLETDRLMEELSKINELTVPKEEVHSLVTEVLLRALKYDAPMSVLTESREFWPLWEIHYGLISEKPSAKHLKRMQLYKKSSNHAHQWLEEHTMGSHRGAVEHEIHDVQEALQEFYRWVQEGVEKGSGQSLTELRNELLVERVFFSRLFSYLKRQGVEGRWLRQEFSFVDKYFEAIYRLLF